MTISNSFPLPGAAGSAELPSLDAFQSAAEQGNWVHVSQDGSQWQVRATGTTPSQRSVAWVEPQSDATSTFVGALGQSFSRGIQAAVARELGLQPAPGRPLSARTVLQAIDMAQTSQTAMSGVDFLTRLNVSAASGSAAFAEVCRLAALDPAAFDPQQRAAIDARMQQRFDAASAQGLSPVSEPLARQWLAEELRQG